MTHKDLIVYKKSQELVGIAYKFIEGLPKKEFDLISQMKKSTFSVPLNIAEGAGRNFKSQFLFFLNVALGSITELEAQYQICLIIEISEPNPELEDKINHVSRLLVNLIKSLNKKTTPQPN